VTARWLLGAPPRAIRELLEQPSDFGIDLDAGAAALDKLNQPPPPGCVVVVRSLEAVLYIPEARDRVLDYLRACASGPLFVLCALDPIDALEASERARLGAEAEPPLPTMAASIPTEEESPAGGTHTVSAARQSGERLMEWTDLLARLERARFGVCTVAEAERRLERPALPRATLRFLVDECRWSETLLAIGERLAAHPRSHRLGRHELVELVLDAASSHYASLWRRCDDEEKLLLLQIARDGLANPHQPGVLRHLRRRRLVRADPRVRIVNESFRRFISEAESDQQIAAWEHPKGKTTSARIRGPLAALAVVVAGLLLFTQQAFVTSTVTFAAGAVGLIGAARGLLARQGMGPPTA
jgi:hypothetical protein